MHDTNRLEIIPNRGANDCGLLAFTQALEDMGRQNLPSIQEFRHQILQERHFENNNRASGWLNSDGLLELARIYKVKINCYIATYGSDGKPYFGFPESTIMDDEATELNSDTLPAVNLIMASHNHYEYLKGDVEQHILEYNKLSTTELRAKAGQAKAQALNSSVGNTRSGNHICEAYRYHAAMLEALVDARESLENINTSNIANIRRQADARKTTAKTAYDTATEVFTKYNRAEDARDRLAEQLREGAEAGDLVDDIQQRLDAAETNYNAERAKLLATDYTALSEARANYEEATFRAMLAEQALAIQGDPGEVVMNLTRNITQLQKTLSANTNSASKLEEEAALAATKRCIGVAQAAAAIRDTEREEKNSAPNNKPTAAASNTGRAQDSEATPMTITNNDRNRTAIYRAALSSIEAKIDHTVRDQDERIEVKKIIKQYATTGNTASFFGGLDANSKAVKLQIQEIDALLSEQQHLTPSND